MSHDYSCIVPVPHRHRKPTPTEIEATRYQVTISHPSRCAWRKDVYDGCSCGVTGAVMALYDLMKEEP